MKFTEMQEHWAAGETLFLNGPLQGQFIKMNDHCLIHQRNTYHQRKLGEKRRLFALTCGRDEDDVQLFFETAETMRKLEAEKYSENVVELEGLKE